MMSSDIKARGLADSLQSRNLNAAFVKEGALLRPGRITVISGELTAGFRFWNENWLLLTENDICMQKKRRLHTKNSGAQLQYFSEIKAGDYVSIQFTVLDVISALRMSLLTACIVIICCWRMPVTTNCMYRGTGWHAA